MYYPYLVIFALNCPDVTICAIFTLDRYSSIETPPLCNFRAIGQLFMEILHFKELGDTQSVVMNAVWVYLLMLYPCIKF